jgi:hypothetical protein
MKAFIFLVSFAAALVANAEGKKLLSTFTSIKDSCVEYDSASLHKDPEIDFLTEECPGLGGYQVMIAGGDLRYPMHLVYNGKKIELTALEGFHDMGSSKIEWLFTRSSEGVVEYKALIHRITYDNYSEDSSKMKRLDVLTVTRLDKENTCPVAIVKQSKDMNQKARALAEKADTLKCLDLGEVEY